jgi:hypothetical protein
MTNGMLEKIRSKAKNRHAEHLMHPTKESGVRAKPLIEFEAWDSGLLRPCFDGQV